MTRVTRILAALLLGVPGFMMILVGFGASMFTSAIIAKGSIPLFPAGVLALAIWLSVASVGFLMFSFVEIMSGNLRYRIPGRHVPASLGWDLASLLSTSAVFCSLIAVASAVTSRHTAWPWLAAMVISILLVTGVLRIRAAALRRWEKEAPEAEPTPRP